MMLLLLACVPELHTIGGGGPWVAPENSWPMSSPPAGLVGEGYDEGEVVPDARMLDQLGQEVALWQFYGSVVAVDFSTMWCAPCQQLAVGVQETADEFADQGFVYLTILPQDLGGEIPEQDDLEQWASTFDIAQPVLSDNIAVAEQAVPSQNWPVVLVIGRDMRVKTRLEGPTEKAVHDAIKQAL